MGNAERTVFVPVLTVMVDYGNAPFLWLANKPDQGGVGSNLCDGTFWDESLPISENLWREFAEWAIEFDCTSFYSDDFNADDWDWPAFHVRGLKLSRMLKEEVGDAHRVVYEKPFEDPNHRIEERTEILSNGGSVLLPPKRSHHTESPRFCEHILSGGQTGADRGALDFAIRRGYTHGGWAPRGRLADDGSIPAKYQLTELQEGSYRQRTRRNVEDSDGTLIVNLGELEGGTLTTQTFAQKAGKPFLVVQLDAEALADVVPVVISWLRTHEIKILNVAGPRESRRPGIYGLTVDLLDAVDSAMKQGLIHIAQSPSENS